MDDRAWVFRPIDFQMLENGIDDESIQVTAGCWLNALSKDFASVSVSKVDAESGNSIIKVIHKGDISYI